MHPRQLRALLDAIHSSIERVASDLASDRPQLAVALRKEGARLPRADELPGGLALRATASRQILVPPMPRQEQAAAACAELRPLLYEALDEGLLSAERFDVLMVRRGRAARALGRRARGVRYGAVSSGSPSDSESSESSSSSTPRSPPRLGASARR
jgi:hypothetical protein